MLLLLLLLNRFSCVRLCVTPIDGSPPGSLVPGILQARTLVMTILNTWSSVSLRNLLTLCGPHLRTVSQRVRKLGTQPNTE